MSDKMKKYIEREAVLSKLRNHYPKPDDMIASVVTIPAADVVEVQHTKNIAKDYADCDQFVCKKCGVELQGWYMVEHDMDDGEETIHEYVMRYCPNCGRKIDGGEENG